MSGDLDTVIARCDDPGVKAQLKRLTAYADYVYLCEATGETYSWFCRTYPDAPLRMKSIYKVFDGGLLFDITLLAHDTTDGNLIVRRPGFRKIDAPFVKKDLGMPEKFRIFALTCYGNLYCFTGGSEEIIEWSVPGRKITARYANAAIWLGSEIKEAESLISEGLLTPLAANLEQKE